MLEHAVMVNMYLECMHSFIKCHDCTNWKMFSIFFMAGEPSVACHIAPSESFGTVGPVTIFWLFTEKVT
jgi:hypothetical protein